MRRTKPGHHVATKIDRVKVQAFVPSKLPPDPPLKINGSLPQLQEQALLALGGLNTVLTLLPDKALFLYSYVRKEAVLSSQIEGTKSSLSDLLLFESDQTPGVPIDDVTEVSNYVRAMEYGLRRIQEGEVISNTLIRDIHGILLSSGRGHNMNPGQFRDRQVWVGDWDPTEAELMPPPHSYVEECMTDLMQFLNSENLDITVISKAALAHVQFETIHPFLDGNGRVGRLLITLIMCQAGALNEPLLYLSLYFKQYRRNYYDLLTHVRETGDWEKWLSFFFNGVVNTAREAIVTAQRLTTLFQSDVVKIQTEAGRRAGSVLRVHQALKDRPVINLRFAESNTGLTYTTVSHAMDVLCKLGVVREVTGSQRNRYYAYVRYLDILNEGTEIQ